MCSDVKTLCVSFTRTLVAPDQPPSQKSLQALFFKLASVVISDLTYSF